MATTLQLRRYNTATIAGTTGADGEVLVDTTKRTLVVQDGSTSGGTPLATEGFVTSGLASLQTTVSAALVNYTINANLTSTLTAYPTNANLTSTLTGYPTNANLTSTVSTAISNLVGGAPAILDTLGEIATALGNNSSLAVTLTSSIALKATSSDLSYLAWTSIVSRLQSSGYTLTLSSNGALVPGSANMDLGTSSVPFRSLYITNQTFYFGGSAVSIDSSNTLNIVTGSSTSTLVNTTTLNTATSAVQSNITVLLYTQVSSVSSSITFYVDNQTSSITSSITQQINQVSSTLITYVDSTLSSALTSLGTVSDLNLSSAGFIIFSGPGVEARPLGPLFSSASIGTGATSILIRTPSFPMASSILNLTSGSTIFADVSSSGTSIQLPFDIIGTPSWVSSYGSSIVNQYQFYGNFGSGSSYTLTSSVNTSYTHTLEYFANSANGHGILYEGSDFNIVSGNLVVYPSIPYVYHWILYETSGTTTSVLLIPITPNTDTQNNWSGNPVYFNNLDVGYTTSSTDFNGSDPGKLVPVPTLGQPTFTENGHQVWPAGWLQTPNNFYLQTSSTGPTFQFTTSGSVVLPTDGQLRNGYPGNAGSSNDGSSWFVTPPSQPGGVASANGEQYIQINNGVQVEIGTNYTSSSGYAWIFDQSGNTIFPTGVSHSSSGSGVKFSSGYDKSFQIETTTTSTSKLWNFTAQGNLTLPLGGDIKNSSGNSIICNIPCPTSSVPATMTSTGTAGQLAYNSSHVYVCVATDTWRRASLGTF